MVLSPLESEHMSPVCPVGNLSKSQPPGAAIVNIITQPLKLQWLPSWHVLCPLYSSIRDQGGIFYLLPLLLWLFVYTINVIIILLILLLSYGKFHLPEFWFPLISWKLELNLRMYCILTSRHLSVPCTVSCNFSHTWYSFVSGDMRRYTTGRCYKSCWPGLGWEIMNGGRGKHFKMAENIFWLQEIKKIQSRH